MKQAVHKHHILSQAKHYRKKYGKLLDDRRNIQYLCYQCHECSVKDELILDKFTEKQFCEALKIEFKE